MSEIAVQIVVKGQLDPRWSGWLEGLQVEPLESGETRISGCLTDHSALYGLLARLGGLGMRLVSCCVGDEAPG